MENNNYKVYVHANKVNGKRYVGITKNSLKKRFNNGNGYKYDRLFWRAIQKYGWDGFTHYILFDNLDRNTACRIEQEYIQKWNLMDSQYGYNLTSGGESNYYVSEETRQKIGDIKRKHGGVGTRLYKTYYTMKCNHSICDEWEDFVTFRDWALHNNYNNNMSLCRIDNNLPFSPTNCIFQTKDKQHDYRSDKIELTFNGETHNLRDWAKIIGITRATLYSRLYQGYTTEEILSTPIKKKQDGLPKNIEKHGETSYRVCVSYKGKRYKIGKIPTLEQAIQERDKLFNMLQQKEYNNGL